MEVCNVYLDDIDDEQTGVSLFDDVTKAIPESSVLDPTFVQSPLEMQHFYDYVLLRWRAWKSVAGELYLISGDFCGDWH